MANKRQLETMGAGECRWVGRPDIHVYCNGSVVDGRYRSDVRVYKIKTINSIGSVWDAAGWTTADHVVRLINKEIENDR